MDRIPTNPHKRSLGLYAFGVVLVVVAGAGVAYFAYSNSQAVAAARDSIAAEAARGPRVVVATVAAGPTTRQITLLGDTKPYSTATLFAKVSGYIKTVSVDKGDMVRAGQVLAEVESAETDSQYASAVADLDYKTRFAARSRELLRTGNVAPQADEQAQSSMRMAQEAVRNLATMMSYETIKAPFDGTVIGRFADPGALLQSAMTNQASSLPVLMIADNSRLRVGVYVEQRDVAAVHVGDVAEVTDASNSADRRMAKITRTAGTLDPRTRTLYVEMEVDNRDNFLVPGSFAYVSLRVPVPSLPQVPVAALVQRGGALLVATVAEDGAIRFKPIKVASTDGIVANVAEGVSAGDRVALNVPNEVTDGTRIRPVLASR
jgi:RND family efflux transporter MFP subunit